jgi:hypothetical protein
LSDGMSNLTTDDATSNAPPAENGNDEAGSWWLYVRRRCSAVHH